MNTPFEKTKAWLCGAGEDLRMCVAILAIWFASWALPAGHASQVHLRNAVQVMDD